METEYNVDGAVSKCGVRSEAMKALDVAMHYNYNLWMAHYLLHLNQVETLANIGDVTMLSRQEMLELNPNTTRYMELQQQIGNSSPQDLTENPIVVRSITQFSWGSRYSPGFVHSLDNISCMRASLGKLGK